MSFGVRTSDGLRGVGGASATVPSASVVKAMLLVAYLRRAGRPRGARSRRVDRALLGPMIRRSDNAAASRVCNIVG